MNTPNTLDLLLTVLAPPARRGRLAVLLLGLVFAAAAPASAQSGSIAGTVIDDASGESLPGVNIQLVGTQRGTITDADGRFEVENVEAGEYDVRVSFIGYVTEEREGVVVEAGETTEVNFQLVQSTIELDEVVAIGYGTVRRSELTGSVVSIDAEELTELPVTNVVEALQGEVAGLDIVNQSGETAAGLNFTIRGNRSIEASNSPLFVVDGVQYGNIDFLNPNDIASLQVLKDASTTAIYGSRGANGVILITTKQGTTGQTRVTVNAYAGATQSTGYPAFNGPDQYIAQLREAARTIGQWESPADDENLDISPDQLENYRNGISTDYRDLLLQTGVQQSYQVGVSTGSDNTQAYLSVGALDEQGIVEMDELRRYTVRLNLSQQLGNYVRVGTNTQVAYTDQDRRPNPLNLANKISPLVQAYNDDGTINVRPTDRDISPLADEQPDVYDNNTKDTDLLPTLYVEVTPLENLSFRSDLGFNLNSTRQGIFAASETIDRNGSAPEARYLTTTSRGLSFENVLTYGVELGQHSVKLTGIGSYLASQTEDGFAIGTGQLLNSQQYYGIGDAPDRTGDTDYVESALLSFAGRVNYGWKDRYLLTLTGRADGSSVLAEGNKWSFFPSIAGAWRMTEEPFMQSQEIFNELKLRLSYGVAGNSAVVPYSSQALLTRIPFAFGESSAAGLAFSDQIGNPDLGWELSYTTNFGVDFGLWDNRVYASLDLYNTRTEDLLLPRFLPPSSGATTVIQNIGSTRNRGIELALQTNNIVKENFLWQTDLTFFANQEEILSLTGEGDQVADGWFIGQPVNAFYDYEKIGIWQLDEAEEAAQFGQEPGEIKVRDQNGDGEITDEDRVVLGQASPKWSGSLQNKVIWGDFDVTAVIFARVGQMMNYEYYNSYKTNGVENGAAVDYWTPENPTNEFPRPNATFSPENYRYYSSLLYEDASFVKLRNVTVGYTLPQELSSQFALNKVRVYFTGKNLWTISGVEDYDPERGGGLSFPMTRIFAGGIDLGF